MQTRILPAVAHAARSRFLRIFLACVVLICVGVTLVALTNHLVVWSSSDAYCGGACHSMTWANAAYQKSPHFTNRVGVRASCGDCHIPYDAGHTTAVDYAKLLLFKTDRGFRDTWHEVTGSIATKEEWENRRPALRATFESYLTRHNYITCRGCHSLQAFAGPRSQMKLVIHRGLSTQNNYNCLDCHSNIGHVYVEPGSTRGSTASGWYTVEQAAAGKQLFERSCSPCHGTRLEGTAAAPALSGASWKQSFAGAKLLTVWGEIKGPMAQDANVNLSTQQSLDILAFLLEQNGLPAGTQPLADTRQLSDTLPSGSNARGDQSRGDSSGGASN
jgi:nitrate/TMAO reductase-like tetraheme cytochrome c subunit